MQDFIKALFDVSQKLAFQYKNYDVVFYKEKYENYYLILFLKNENELMSFWKEKEELFQKIKEDREIYEAGMDKCILCLYCLEVSDEEYYQTFATGTISNLSRKISLIEEDLDYFSKHVFLYTQKMRQFAQKHVGEFDALCREHLIDEKFNQYKNDNQNNWEYDFLINLFIKFPFLCFEKYQMGEQREYRTVESFIQEKMNGCAIDTENVQERIKQLETQIDDENKFYSWLDSLTL